MNRPYLTRYATALRSVLSRRNLEARARQTGHCRRLRDVTPQRLLCALVESLGALRVRTIADILRTFNAQTGLATKYKPFHNRLARPEFARFMREVFLDLLRQLSQNVLKASMSSGLAHFKDVVVQDGSSFAVHDALAGTFGGRFTKVRPAAVELHTCMSVLHDEVLNAQLAADKEAERGFLPEPRELTGKLLLADRGYPSLDYFEQLIDAGAFFLMRAKGDMNPKVVSARGPGGRMPRVEGYHLQDIMRWLPRRRLDLDVTWERPGGQTLRLRLVLIWVAPNKTFTVLITNVGRSILTANQVGETYRLRWQVELLFKEWKSFSNLHEIGSANPYLVEGLIWASLCAAVLKRSLAHASQRIGSGVAISTQITAMSGVHILLGLLMSVLRGFRDLEIVLERGVRFLWNNAARAHPKRDRLKGRLRYGIEYVGLRA
ncbi:MAG: IS4 family transposase [Gemmatimonadales bacterium]